MQTPKTLLTGLKTRGDFRALSERASQERKPTSVSDLPDHPIWEVWNQIKSAYPGPCANWEDEPPMIWAYAIEGLRPEQVAQGIRNLVSREGDFPPSAGQFRDLCLMDMDWEHKQLKYIEPTGIDDLTAKEKRTAFGVDAIRKLREECGL
jgi:hypothetical protein